MLTNRHMEKADRQTDMLAYTQTDKTDMLAYMQRDKADRQTCWLTDRRIRLTDRHTHKHISEERLIRGSIADSQCLRHQY